MNRTLLGVVVLLCCAGPALAALSSEQQKLVGELRTEIAKTQEAIKEARTEDQKLTGGLIKLLIEARMETLRNTEALLQQRVRAIEAGAKLSIEIPATTPDPALAAQLDQEIAALKAKIESVQAEANKYSGGLIRVQFLAAAATQTQTLAMLEQRALIAKYGLGFPRLGDLTNAKNSVSPPATSPEIARAESAKEKIKSSPANEVVKVRLLSKRLAGDVQKLIVFDLEFTADGLDKPARAIKGVVNLNDLFGAKKMGIGWTIDRELTPGSTINESGQGFSYNRFMEPHQWVNNTDLRNMAATFTVQSILYQDGTRIDF